MTTYRDLLAVGTVHYNGFTFPGPFEADVQASPVRDTSGRYIKYIKYTITVKTIIVPDDLPLGTAGAAVDPNLENIRCKLQKAGGAFIFINQGIGRDFAVNAGTLTVGNAVPSFKVDPTFGPFPTILNWKPAGSNRAVHLVWSLEVTIPDCCSDSGTGLYNQFLEHNYSINWNIGEGGATTRTINGFFETPGFRPSPNSGLNGSRALISSTADQVWNLVYSRCPVVPGFRRTSNRALSLDKRKINYTITDTEIPSDNPFYRYMVNMDITHRVGANFPELFKPQNSFSGQITLAPGVPRHFAYLAFAKVAKERYDKAASLPAFPSKGLSNKDEAQRPNRFLLSYSFEESLYSREFSFEFSWWFICNLKDVFKGSGLFSPVQAGQPSWITWSQSMAEIAQSARGIAKMQNTAQEDAMQFSCDYGQLPTINNGVLKSATFVPQFIMEDVEREPTKEQSYNYAQDEILTDTNLGSITHTVSADLEASDAEMISRGAKEDGGVNLTNIIKESSNAPPQVIQLVGGSRTRIAIRGILVRTKYHPELPTVTKVGGVVPSSKRVVSRTKRIGQDAMGRPIFAMAYTLYLDLPSRPSGDILSSLETNAYSEKKL